MLKKEDTLHATLKPFEGSKYGRLHIEFVGTDHMVVVNEGGSHMLIPFEAMRVITISKDQTEIAWISGNDGNRVP